MRVTRILTTVATGTLLALAAVTPALADAREDFLTSETGQVGRVDEDDILNELRPAIIGVHQGISASFVAVPPPNVQAPQM